MSDTLITTNSTTIEIPDWMNPEHDYTVVYIDGTWMVRPF